MSTAAERGEAVASDILEHFGVKGMKWGVRRERKQAAKTAKKLAKGDKKYEKDLSGMKGYIKVQNTVAEHVNPKLNALNANPKYAGKDLTQNSALRKSYFKEYEKVVESACREATKQLGANPSGTKQLKIVRYGEGENTTWAANLVDIKHADIPTSFRIVPYFNKTGHITGQTIEPMSKDMTQSSIDFVEDFLEHYGVKGMKWGVHRRKSQVSRPKNNLSRNQMIAIYALGVTALANKGVREGVKQNRKDFKEFKSARKAEKANWKAEDKAAKNAPKAVTVTQKGNKLKAKGGENQPPSQDAINAKALEQTIKKSGYQALSNDHLRVYNERLNLEANAKRLRSSNVSTGQRFAKEVLGVASDAAIADIKNSSAARKVGGSFTSSPSTSTALVRR